MTLITTLKRVISDCGTQYKKLIKNANKDSQGFYTAYNIVFPNYVQSLNIQQYDKSLNEIVFLHSSQFSF